MEKKINLSPSLEDYLEAILILERKNRVARVKDIAEALQVQMPSVTGALKNLKRKGLINYEKNSYISLTEVGLSMAEAIESKHSIIRNFLENVLLLSSEEATDQACKIEHVITPETAKRLKNCAEYITETLSSDSSGKKWTDIILPKKTAIS